MPSRLDVISIASRTNDVRLIAKELTKLILNCVPDVRAVPSVSRFLSINGSVEVFEAAPRDMIFAIVVISARTISDSETRSMIKAVRHAYPQTYLYYYPASSLTELPSHLHRFEVFTGGEASTRDLLLRIAAPNDTAFEREFKRNWKEFSNRVHETAALARDIQPHARAAIDVQTSGDERIVDAWASSIASARADDQGLMDRVATRSPNHENPRELFISDVLERILPENISAGSGQIVDYEGTLSAPIDVVLYRKEFPAFRTSGDGSVYLLEGVVAGFDVKYSLSAGVLMASLENCRSMRSLKAHVVHETMDEYSTKLFGFPFLQLPAPKQHTIEEQLLPPFYIVGLSGDYIDLESLTGTLRRWIVGHEVLLRHLPSVIATEGCVAMRNGTPKWYGSDDRCTWEYIAAVDSSPLRFVLSHMLMAIMCSLGSPRHALTGIEYDVSPYTIPQDPPRGFVGVI